MSKLKLSALHLAIGSTLLSGFAFNASAAVDSVEEVERIEVTGSRIKRTDLESAVPVTVITADDMVRQGFTNVQDALASLSSVTGSMNQQSIHGFTPAASSINLRNAGANRTLTLINGQRLNQYPKAQNGTDNFVDTANLPMDAIARIEILNSGGGAIYGADAVGGVVNIILKDNYEGIGVRVRHGDTTEGGGATNKISLAFGASSDKGNVSTFIEYSDSETLKATDRENFGLHTDKVPHSDKSLYSSYGARIGGGTDEFSLGGLNEADCTAGGFFFRPNGVCGFDRSKWRDLSPETNRVSVITTFNYELSDDIRLTGRVDISESSSSRDIEPMGIAAFNVNVTGDVATMTADDSPGRSASFDKATAFGGDFATAVDADYWYVRRAWEFGNRHQDNESRNFFATAGLEGSFSDSIDWDFSMSYGRSRVEVFASGYATSDGMFDYLTSGDSGVSMLAPFSDEMVEATAYGTYEIANSDRINYQFNLSGDAFELPAGMVVFAAGMEWSKQTFDNDTDAESKKGSILTTGGASGAGARDMMAIYSEMIFPVTDTLNINAALRFDDFSDFGNEMTPQVSMEYRPLDGLLVRGVIGKVFRAPDMQRVYGDPTSGSDSVIDYKGCAQIGGTPGDGLGDTRPIDPCNELYISTLTGPNADLKAETGYTANFGFVYSTDNYNVSVDLWKWKLDDMVNDIDVDKVAQEFERYEHMITRDATGFVDTITATAQNLSYQEVAGIDFNGTYTWELDNLGELSYNLQGAYLLQSEGQVDPTATVDKDLDDTNMVKLRMTSAVTWNLDGITTTLFAKYIGGHHGVNYLAQNTPANEGALTVPSHITWNFTGGYSLTDDASVRLGVVNMFDKGPNFDPTETSWPHYERGYYDAQGRKVFVEAEYKF